MFRPNNGVTHPAVPDEKRAPQGPPRDAASACALANHRHRLSCFTGLGRSPMPMIPGSALIAPLAGCWTRRRCAGKGRRIGQ
ncbi:hypothetical protein EDWATA_01261 [Edwardsiella tarda ATCC 23685]|uniref:Uncharacterized protein n=1 Tax=Edwardsiella tarda ATCC 23685 TaxID=500638 RepID=D4F3F5_EDWTA|nr:hypothetical protein EDWATA_01261 [Edwardsiella tarda ATCC 23685]